MTIINRYVVYYIYNRIIKTIFFTTYNYYILYTTTVQVDCMVNHLTTQWQKVFLKLSLKHNHRNQKDI